jgi:hypothetical protein
MARIFDEQQGNEHLAALTYGQLSLLAAEQQQVHEAGRLCLRALIVFRKFDDAHSAQTAIRQFVSIHESASPVEKHELENLWTKAGLGPYPPQENS